MPTFPPNPMLDSLRPLLGEWEVESPQHGGLKGKATFGWTDGGAFLAYRTEASGAFPSNTSVISRDDARDTYWMLYYDERGVSRVYEMSFDGNVWKLWRDAPEFSQRFTGELNVDGGTITGRWESCEDGKTWAHDFDVVYRRGRSPRR